MLYFFPALTRYFQSINQSINQCVCGLLCFLSTRWGILHSVVLHCAWPEVVFVPGNKSMVQTGGREE
ncbi:hypothetical protein CRUP_004144 [Coryphaenoides rupestris]|nr:hypothetical protein CRUP_004144 [Coryphaenoides rupestris]